MSIQYSRKVFSSGIVSASALLLGLCWVMYLLDPDAWPGLRGTVLLTALAALNIVVTTVNTGLKIAVVRQAQRWLLNPLVRGLHAVGLNPLGVSVLESRGRVSGLPRRTPVGDGRTGDVMWIVAEHGVRANWVRNIAADPRVRVRVRIGTRYRWLDGVAEVLPDDDPIARQRAICRWRPLRMLNAAVVRILGAELVTVRIRLQPAPVLASAS